MCSTVARPASSFGRNITIYIERILYMKLPFFASFIVFCIWLAFQLNRQKKRESRASESFWAREAAANSTRKKPLDDLEYITIPFEFLPMQTMADKEDVAECHRLLSDLSEQKIVNFTGFTNTDLKLRYGVANINLLMDYDQNYTVLVRTLQKWASLLYKEGHIEETKTILEFAVSTKTDVSTTYSLLAEIYQKTGHPEKIESLLQIAEGLHSAMKPSIVRTLKGFGPYTD